MTDQKMTDQQGRVWELSVVMTGGQVFEHRYQLPAAPSEALAVLQEVFGGVEAAFKGTGGHPTFYLRHPTAIYNVNHLVALRFKTLKSKELEDLVRRASESMGFKPQDQST